VLDGLKNEGEIGLTSRGSSEDGEDNSRLHVEFGGLVLLEKDWYLKGRMKDWHGQ
jgi:hypothetical protein